MYEGNPGEIDFGSSQRDVLVSEGSSHRESTVCVRGKVVIEDIQGWICCGSILFLVYILCYFTLGKKMYDDEFETM